MCAYGPNLFGYADAGIDAAYTAQLGHRRHPDRPHRADGRAGRGLHGAWSATPTGRCSARTARTPPPWPWSPRGPTPGARRWCWPRAPITARRPGACRGPPARRPRTRPTRSSATTTTSPAWRRPWPRPATISPPSSPPPSSTTPSSTRPSPTRPMPAARASCATQTGALLVVDDVRAGLRVARDCSWSTDRRAAGPVHLGQVPRQRPPDLGPAGNDKARKAAASIFVTGSFWYQAAPMAAALETLRLVRETDYLERIEALGDAAARRAWPSAPTAAGFGLRQTGPATMPLFLFDDDPDLRQGLLLVERDAGARRLRPSLAQHVPLRGDDGRRHRPSLGRRRGRLGALKHAPTLQPVPEDGVSDHRRHEVSLWKCPNTPTTTDWAWPSWCQGRGYAGRAGGGRHRADRAAQSGPERGGLQGL